MILKGDDVSFKVGGDPAAYVAQINGSCRGVGDHAKELAARNALCHSRT